MFHKCIWHLSKVLVIECNACHLLNYVNTHTHVVAVNSKGHTVLFTFYAYSAQSTMSCSSYLITLVSCHVVLCVIVSIWIHHHYSICWLTHWVIGASACSIMLACQEYRTQMVSMFSNLQIMSHLQPVLKVFAYELSSQSKLNKGWWCIAWRM